MSGHGVLRLTSALCRALPDFPGRWRLVRRGLTAVRKAGRDMGTTVVHTSSGFRFECDLGDWVGQYVFVTGSYEEPTTALMTRLVARGATVVDLGANVGYFTVLLSRLVGPEGHVHAFEPMPHALARLRRHVSMNELENVVIHEAAASSAPGSASFYLGPPEHTSISSLLPIADARTIEVRTVTLDETLADVGRIDLLKMDVEGAEGEALAGATTLLDGGLPWIIAEVSDRQWPALLLDRGYEMYLLDWRGLSRVRDLGDQALPTQYNAFFTLRGLPPGITAIA